MPRAEVLSLKRAWGWGGVGAQYLALCKVKPGREALEVVDLPTKRLWPRRESCGMGHGPGSSGVKVL